jgi:hypothetical protein
VHCCATASRATRLWRVITHSVAVQPNAALTSARVSISTTGGTLHARGRACGDSGMPAGLLFGDGCALPCSDHAGRCMRRSAPLYGNRSSYRRGFYRARSVYRRPWRLQVETPASSGARPQQQLQHTTTPSSMLRTQPVIERINRNLNLYSRINLNSQRAQGTCLPDHNLVQYDQAITM